MISSLVVAFFGSIFAAPTPDVLTWIMLTGVALIPMALILPISIQVVRAQRIEYSIFRAIALGVIIGMASVALVKVTTRFIIPAFV